jgi:hypothetical protein
MGNTPALFTSNMSASVPAVIKRQENPCQPSIRMFPKMIARNARMSSVARPVSPVKKTELKRNWFL